MASKQRGLGRGLDALFAEQAPINRVDNEKSDAGKKNSIDVNNENGVLYVDIHQIKPNEDQPRKTFDEDKLKELASSILEHGIIQPVIVRKKGALYEIVAGERRWRAARIAKLREVPCIVKSFSDEENMLIAIIENMQREDLNPIEEAEGIEKVIKAHGLTQEEVAKTLGKSRPYITNAIRLLKLDGSIIESIKDGKLSAGHGRTLLSIEDKEERRNLANKIMQESLSVREVEKIISDEKGKVSQNKTTRKNSKDVSLHAERIEREWSEKIGTKVAIKGDSDKGRIEIFYYNHEEFEKIAQLFE